MAQVQYIKYLYENEEKSLNEIAKEMGLNYRTVRKYAYKDDWNEEKLPNIDAQSYPSLGEYIPTIDKWLEGDLKLPRKQRHTAMRIFTRLRDECSFKGSYSSVKKYVRKKKYLMRTSNEGYLPLAHQAGEGQVDFGDFIYYDGSGCVHKAYALTMTFPYSNMGYTQVFPSENQECLMEGMKRIFEHIGGVPIRLRFDNMTTAVVQVLKGHERVLTDGFTRFMLHYRFQGEFCNPNSGHEKGNVENKVGYSRRNFLVPVPTITSFEEFNQTLWGKCETDVEREHYIKKEPIIELFEEDKAKLLTLPEHPFSVFRYASVTVNKTGIVTIDTNRYGLSPTLAGAVVQAKIFFDHIEFFYDHSPVGSFVRSYKGNDDMTDWTKYVDTLCRKPYAVEHTTFFKQMPERWQEYLKKAQGTVRKSALHLLCEIVRDGNAVLCDNALELAAENGRTDVDSLRQCYYLIAKKEFHPAPLTLEDAPALNYQPDLSAYDGLMGGDKRD